MVGDELIKEDSTPEKDTPVKKDAPIVGDASTEENAEVEENNSDEACVNQIERIYTDKEGLLAKLTSYSR